jgi:magnesium-transporting ATPase (P-type)
VYLVKGSPEVISSLCQTGSVPSDNEVVLAKLARQGQRVIAMAYRLLSPSISLSTLLESTQEKLEGFLPNDPQNENQNGPQNDHQTDPNSSDESTLDSMVTGVGSEVGSGFESGSGPGLKLGSGSGLVYLGLLSLTNRLKEDTCSTIAELRAAKLHVNMITGDNIHTGRLFVLELCLGSGLGFKKCFQIDCSPSFIYLIFLFITLNLALIILLIPSARERERNHPLTPTLTLTLTLH